MRILEHYAVPGKQGRSLIILMPGALQQPEDLVNAGFVDALRRRNLAIDLVLVDLGLHYIGETIDGTALQRLHETVVQPRGQQGYEQVWLGGISIGGFMTLAYAERFPRMVNGLCLLAPYPGNRILTNEIQKAGDIKQWQAINIEGDGERRVWQWLKRQAELPVTTPMVHIGYGREDRFASGQQLMARALAEHHVDAVTGGHDWPAWQQLWENFLDRFQQKGSVI